MKPLMSLVIPVFREPLLIVRQLHYLRTCSRIAECEIIVVDGDDGSSLTPSLTPTDVLPLTVVHSPPGRGVQLNAGARLAGGDALLFLHVDTILPRRFVSLVLHALAHRPAGAFDLSIESTHPVVRLISFVGMIRSRITRIPYGDQGQFIRRDLYDRIGGFPPVPLMEDVALMDAVRQAGERITVIRRPARTSDRRWLAEGAVKATLRNWRLMRSYRSGVPPTRLQSRYRSQVDLDSTATRLILFHRSLRLTGVKTRLAGELGAPIALELYSACLSMLRREVDASGIPAIWFVDDPDAGAAVHPQAIPQHGDTLFARMEDAFTRVFATGTQRAILIGSDIPALDRRALRRAASALRHADAVLGPTDDGGYYLIGFHRSAFTEGLLGPGEAAQQPAAHTMSRIRDAGLRLLTLPVLRDLDTVSDLARIVGESDRRSELHAVVRRRNIKLSVY